MSTKWKYRLEVLAVALLAGALLFWLTGCAGVPYHRDVVLPSGTVQVQEITEHTLPGTGVVLWKDVDVPATGEASTETTEAGGLIKGLLPYAEAWWPLLILAFKRPRDNAIAAVDKALDGDLKEALTSVAAMTGIKHTLPDVKAARAAKDARKAAKKAAKAAHVAGVVA